jgi:hypothetical protein
MNEFENHMNCGEDIFCSVCGYKTYSRSKGYNVFCECNYVKNIKSKYLFDRVLTEEEMKFVVKETDDYIITKLGGKRI